LQTSKGIKELQAQIKTLDPKVASKIDQFSLNLTNTLQVANNENAKHEQIITQKHQELAQKDQELAQKDQELKILQESHQMHKVYSFTFSAIIYINKRPNW
jgi:hypothetical protein